MRLADIPSWIQTRCKYCGNGMVMHYSETNCPATNYTDIAVRLYCLNCHFAVEVAPDKQIIGENFTKTTRGKIRTYNSSMFLGEEE